MKSEMPYLGIAAPERRSIQKELFSAKPIDGWDVWHDTVLTLWRDAEFREERYAAIGLTGHKLYADHQTRDTLRMYEEMIVTRRLVGLRRRYRRRPPRRATKALPEVDETPDATGSTSADMWKRRSSIICQLSLKADIDLAAAHSTAGHGGREFYPALV